MASDTPLKEECSLAHKSKRRRTSPGDHAVLEAAYQANSKPGKEERASIVSQVKLGEKEVQIWFQNRRQNDRRRSKPLQPHELIAHIANTTSSVTALTPSPSQSQAADPTASLLGDSTHVHPTPSPSPETQASQSSTSEEDDAPFSKNATENAATESRDTHAVIPSIQADNRTKQPADTADTAHRSTPPPTRSKSQPASPSSSGRKRSYHEMMMQQPNPVPAQPAPASAEVALQKTKEPLKRSGSVRLAMTVDGAVKIRTNDDLTPSPEKPRSLPTGMTEDGKQRRLSRSVSMVDDLKGPVKAPGSSGVFGRSRDHRKWEFYCDNSADKALSIQAEAERSGSAVGAINLLRSNSLKGRGLVMSPTPSRVKVKPIDVVKAGKPKLSRAKSSLARLNSQPDVEMKGGSKPSRHVRSPSDSEKENWAPGTRMSENPLRRTQPSTNRRPVLQDNEAVIFPDASTARAKIPAGKLSSTKEKARGEDLDCIQGLLSLSQGAWR